MYVSCLCFYSGQTFQVTPDVRSPAYFSNYKDISKTSTVSIYTLAIRLTANGFINFLSFSYLLDEYSAVYFFLSPVLVWSWSEHNRAH